MNATSLLFLLLTATPTEEVPPRVTVLLQQHCAGCHNADSMFDLSTPPPVRDSESWSAIHKMLETGRMPPSPEVVKKKWKKPGPPPSPLGPGHRQELVSAIAALLAESTHPPALRTQLQLTSEDWLLIVREVARPFMSEEALAELVAPYREFAPEARPQVVSIGLCSRIIDIDQGRPAAQRLLWREELRAGDAPPAAAVAGMVRKVFELTFRQAASASDVDEGRERFLRFLRVTGSPREASVALCSSYLSGVRLLRLELPTPSPKELAQ
ncbi:hypothetical protein HV824_08960 [Myxococcus sp. AM009]|uniref:c-type cytochrome n=1 Tax=unclassified Myxococcus TaxID=2648731 RepID=UPI00159542A5|nr:MULTISPECIES: hypothetical protein [unclassified Myxococcus]NVI98253.1 hypothetical protein [Myxococcus sp. AM009]NVJ14870.1 hypothetical protein [Myxococcus sp. AM010]